MSSYLHERLTRSLLEEMASGSWRDGQRFLSVRDIIRRWHVSQPTVRTSLRTLEALGLLAPAPRSGSFLQRDFQQKAQVLLRRNRTPSVCPPLHLEQKARLLRGVRGGKIALLLETKAAAPQAAYTELPPRLGTSVRECAEAFMKEGQPFEVHFFLYHDNPDHAAWVRQQLEVGGFEGAAVFCRSSHRVVEPILTPLVQRRLPIVMMYDDCQGLPVHSVNLNNVGLGYDAIRKLYALGHRKVTVLVRKGALKLHKARLKGCLLAEAEGGCPGLRLTVLHMGREAPLSRQVRRHFASKPSRPTAVFACESGLAEQLAPFWKQVGLTIPEDLSLLICSSKTGVRGIEVPLDAMSLKMGRRIGRTAARQLLRMQAGEPLEKTVLLDVRHVRRGSTRALGMR